MGYNTEIIPRCRQLEHNCETWSYLVVIDCIEYKVQSRFYTGTAACRAEALAKAVCEYDRATAADALSIATGQRWEVVK